jgi:hypothetical protein
MLNVNRVPGILLCSVVGLDIKDPCASVYYIEVGGKSINRDGCFRVKFGNLFLK